MGVGSINVFSYRNISRKYGGFSKTCFFVILFCWQCTIIFLEHFFFSFLSSGSFFLLFFLLFWQFIYLSWLRYSTVCWGFFVLLSGYLAVPSSESRSYFITPWLLILLYRYGCLGYSVVSLSLWIQIFIHKWWHHHPNHSFNCARLSRLSQARLELKLSQLSLTCNNIHVFYFKWWKK